MPETSLPVEHLFTLNAGTASGAVIQDGPVGTRYIVPVTGGNFEGPKLRGTVELPAGDWVYSRPDGSLKLDVRILLKTEDGANILMSYSGIGTRGDAGLSLRTAPQFETGDERYAWLNSVQAVGVGSSGQGTVTYEVYALR